MNNVFTKSTVLLALLAILLGGGITSCKDDGDSGEAQPGYVGKIYSAKDGKSYLKIDTKDTATYCVWEEGSEVQASARAAATGKYVAHKGEYIITTEYTEKMFFFEVEWTDSEGNECYYAITADVTNDDVFDNFKIDGNDVDFVRLSAAPQNPDNVDDLVIDDSSDDSSDSDDKSDDDSSDDNSNEVAEGRFIKIPAKSIYGTENWTPKSYVFVSGREIEIPAFYMCNHPVTRAEYKEIMEEEPSTSKAYDKDGYELTGDEAGKNPVNGINWYHAIAYCNKLSVKEGLTPCYAINGETIESLGYVPDIGGPLWDSVTCDFNADGYRLPTVVEREWAARGGENYEYAGSDSLDDVAWYSGNNAGGTRDVMTKKPNGYGLYDMNGNVWEWCWDWYDEVDNNTPISGPESGSSRSRCGGAFWSNANYNKVTARTYSYPSEHPYDFGFRVVRTAK